MTSISSSHSLTCIFSFTGFKGLPSSITSILFGSGSAAAASSQSGNGSTKSEAVSGQARDPRKKPVSASNPEKTGSGSSKKSSTLGSMSEADLLAAAAAQMDEIPPLPPMIG